MKTPFQNFMDQAKKFQEGVQKRQHDMGAYYWTLEQKRKKEMARKSSEQLKPDSGRKFKPGISPRVGHERGEGSRYDAGKWAPGVPLDLGARSKPRFQGAAGSTVKRGSIFKAFLVLVFGVAISFGLFILTGTITDKIFHIGPLSFGIGFLAGMVSLIATIKRTRRTARGY